MADQWQRSQWVGRSLKRCHPSVTWGLFIRWQLWINFHHKMPCCMGQIQWTPASAHFLLIFHHLLRKNLKFVRQEHHAPCKWKLSHKLTWFASHAIQWPSYDLLDVHCHHKGASQLARSPWKDAAWRSSKGILPWENLDRNDRHGLPSTEFNWDPTLRQESLEW